MTKRRKPKNPRSRNGRVLELLDGYPRAILEETDSWIDGKPVVVIATDVVPKGPSATNVKTGSVIQTWILRRDIPPTQAAKEFKDFSICGDCKLRGQGSTGHELRACYVNLAMADRVWDAYKDGRCGKMPTSDWGKKLLFEGRVFRFGAYGDPVAVPHPFWEDLAKFAQGWIGYTHQWRECPARFKQLVMASVDSPEEYAEAKASKKWPWRTYRSRLPHEPLLPGEIMCPAAPEFAKPWAKRRSDKGLPPKHVQCKTCLLCDGGHLFPDPRRDIAVVVHGFSTAQQAYTALRASVGHAALIGKKKSPEGPSMSV